MARPWARRASAGRRPGRRRRSGARRRRPPSSSSPPRRAARPTTLRPLRRRSARPAQYQIPSPSPGPTRFRWSRRSSSRPTQPALINLDVGADAYEARRFLFFNARILTLRCEVTCNDALAFMQQRLASQHGQRYVCRRPPRFCRPSGRRRFAASPMVKTGVDTHKTLTFWLLRVCSPADGTKHRFDPFAILRVSIKVRDRSYSCLACRISSPFDSDQRNRRSAPPNGRKRDLR